MNTQKKRGGIQDPCLPCQLKLSKLQEQAKRIERLLCCVKDTLTLSEAGCYTGLQASRLYRLALRGEIPCHQPYGQPIYFNKRELDDWLCRSHCGVDTVVVSALPSPTVNAARV